jgi:hypothetical protein
MTKIKSKRGRPTEYNQTLADLICERVAIHGVGLKKLCDMYDDMPEKAAIRRWCIKHPEFGSQYARAKVQQIDTLVDEIIEIADDSSQDVIINEQGNRICNSEFIARSRLRIDTRKWLASKLTPKVYGLNPVEQEAIYPPLTLKGVTDPNEAAKIYQQIMRRPAPQ